MKKTGLVCALFLAGCGILGAFYTDDGKGGTFFGVNPQN